MFVKRYAGFNAPVVLNRNSLALAQLAMMLEPKFLLSPFAPWNHPLITGTRTCYAFICQALQPSVAFFFDYFRKAKNDPLLFVHLPQPGTTGGKSFGAYTAKALSEALERDGFKKLPQTDFTQIVIPEGHELNAGYFEPPTTSEAGDSHYYHYYPPKKKWYAKNGLFPVDCVDVDGNDILDPQKANRGRYTSFIGFFLSPPDRPPMNIIVSDSHNKILLGRAPKDFTLVPVAK